MVKMDIKESNNVPVKPIKVTCKTCKGEKVDEKNIPCEPCKGEGFYTTKNL